MKPDPGAKPHPLPRWLLSTIVAVLLAAVFAMVIGAGSLDATRGVVGEPGMFPHLEPILSLDQVTSEDVTENLRARQVILQEAVVEEVLGDLAFLAGQDGETVPVVLFGELTGRQRADAVALRAGQRVRIYGILRKAIGPGHLQRLARLEPAAAAKLQGREVYISAMRVAPLPIRETPRPTPPYLITSIAEITDASDARSLRAHDVVLDKVRVLRVVGDHTFLVGSDDAAVVVSLFGEVTRRQADTVTVVREGDVLRIYGTIRLLRSVQEIEDMLMLTAAEAARLRAHTVYISALRVVQLGAGS